MEPRLGVRSLATGPLKVLVDKVTGGLFADSKSNLTVVAFQTLNENRPDFGSGDGSSAGPGCLWPQLGATSLCKKAHAENTICWQYR